MRIPRITAARGKAQFLIPPSIDSVVHPGEGIPESTPLDAPSATQPDVTRMASMELTLISKTPAIALKEVWIETSDQVEIAQVNLQFSCMSTRKTAVTCSSSTTRHRPTGRPCSPGTHRQIRKDCVTDMNTQEHNQVLRLNLLDMARITQRGVDYAIKAYTYKLGNLESCTIVGEDTYEIGALHREITGIVRDVLAMELSGESDLRYMLASERIANALQVVHSQAVEIAANSTRILENGGGLRCADLATMGDLVNGLVRLSVVALSEEDIAHAEVVRRYSRVDRLFELTFYDWYRTIDHGARAQAEFERAIAKHLREIALQTYEMSRAIVFSLEDSWRELASDVDEETLASRETNPVDRREAVPIPDGMEAFLESIDICFADASFWSGL